jgi:hypothetical protein
MSSGQTQHTVPFSIPGALSMLVYDEDHGVDGTLWISGSASDPGGRTTGFVAWISADNTNSLIIRTGPYRPTRIAVASDGTLCTVGSETIRTPSPNAAVIRHFDKSGHTLTSLIQQSTISRVANLERPFNSLQASKDRIAWYCADLVSTGRYVEISLDGTLLTDISVRMPSSPLKYTMTGFAFNDQGDAFLSAIAKTVAQDGPASVQFGVYLLASSEESVGTDTVASYPEAPA